MKILICDQFNAPTPYSLQQTPMKFSQLCAEILCEEPGPYSAPRIIDVDPKDFRAPRCTTVFYELPDGNAGVFATNWDSSD